jgi:mannose/fructose/N-acetylgalactosamine-specific phosphotransferase system component IIB
MPLGAEGRAGGEGGPRVPYRLFRVDDRLLHGQVALGWRRKLGSCGFLLADEALAADTGASTLYSAAAPEGCAVSVVRPADLASGAAPTPPPEDTVLLVRDLSTAALLLRAGVPGPLDLGGLHARPGAREVLSYLFLTPGDEALLAELLHEGHVIYAQDLPGNPRRGPSEWLDLSGRRG